jgi:hypothetical protein
MELFANVGAFDTLRLDDTGCVIFFRGSRVPNKEGNKIIDFYIGRINDIDENEFVI